MALSAWGKLLLPVWLPKAIQIGPGNNEYDFIYVSNLVDAHIFAAQALQDAYGKPPPAAEKRIDCQCSNVTNHERILANGL